MNGIFAGGRAAFRADGLIAVRAAISTVGYWGAAPRTFAGEIESAVGTDFSIGVDLSVALGAGEDHDRKCCAAIDADGLVCQR